MNLHNFKEDFNALSTIVSKKLNITAQAVRRDYFIVLMLDRLSKSEFAQLCVFKGGTSLSKCYPGSIERFSEDIDLTYLGMEQDDKTCEKVIKKIIGVMTDGATVHKIEGEGNARNKSRNVWFETEDNKVKLEIGCTVRPEPYRPKTLKCYIQEYLEEIKYSEAINDFSLSAVTINTLAIERTFLDKIMAVKRHAICGTLKHKVRHIYDVVRLYNIPEIQTFLYDDQNLKKIMELTKNSDSHYLEKRNIPKDYNPLGAYGFETWRVKFNDEIKHIYENLHNDLLYTNERQDFTLAVECFEMLNTRFKEIEE